MILSEYRLGRVDDAVKVRSDDAAVLDPLEPRRTLVVGRQHHEPLGVASLLIEPLEVTADLVEVDAVSLYLVSNQSEVELRIVASGTDPSPTT